MVAVINLNLNLDSSVMWLFTWFLCIIPFIHTQEKKTWEKDVTSEMKIGISNPDRYKVDLKCGPEVFLVNITVDFDFDGVIYTRGDFRNKVQPCFKFKKHFKEKLDNGYKYSFRIPFSKCHTIMDASEEEYQNTLVIQNDEELIMPGDAAFIIACAFSPEVRLGATMLTKAQSKIALVDADPSVTEVDDTYKTQSDSDSVSFPVRKQTKDEL